MTKSLPEDTFSIYHLMAMGDLNGHTSLIKPTFKGVIQQNQISKLAENLCEWRILVVSGVTLFEGARGHGMAGCSID